MAPPTARTRRTSGWRSRRYRAVARGAETIAREHGLAAVSYEDDVHPYSDLANGRLDAVLLDHIIAARALARVER